MGFLVFVGLCLMVAAVSGGGVLIGVLGVACVTLGAGAKISASSRQPRTTSDEDSGDKRTRIPGGLIRDDNGIDGRTGARHDLQVAPTSQGTQVATKECPACAMFNPTAADRCLCGHDFGALVVDATATTGTASTTSAASPNSRDQTRRHNECGMALSRSGDDDGVIREFRKAIALSPRDAEGYYNLGVALGNKGRHAEALSNFRTAVELNPNDAEAHSNFGMMLVAQGDYRAALREFSQTLRLEPGHREATRFAEKLRQMV